MPTPQQESELTSLSLLAGLRAQDSQQWQRFVSVYGPLVFEWCRRAGVNEHDSADVVQEVFQVVATKLDSFRRSRPEDSFHGWLWTVTRNKTNDYFRRMTKQPIAKGGSTANAMMHSVRQELPETLTSEDQQKDQAGITRRILELLRTDFEAKTWKAFWMVAVDELPAKVAASELNMTIGAVYNAKYKVLRRLRSEMEGLM